MLLPFKIRWCIRDRCGSSRLASLPRHLLRAAQGICEDGVGVERAAGLFALRLLQDSGHSVCAAHCCTQPLTRPAHPGSACDLLFVKAAIPVMPEFLQAAHAGIVWSKRLAKEPIFGAHACTAQVSVLASGAVAWMSLLSHLLLGVSKTLSARPARMADISYTCT
jgi:hypothetical protein